MHCDNKENQVTNNVIANVSDLFRLQFGTRDLINNKTELQSHATNA